MPRFLVRAILLCPLLITSACTQPSAPISMQGQNYFGKSGEHKSPPAIAYRSSKHATPSYAKSDYKPYEPAPVYLNTKVSQETQQSASIQSIGVSDLAPPAKNENKQASAEPARSANPWTKKERVVEKSETPKPVAQLDRIIGKKESKEKSAKTASSFMWPVNARKVVSSFGPKGGGKVNDGINIASAEGEPVWASSDGEVVYVGNELKGYGNMVLIKHAGGKTTSYAHLNRATVDKYDRVHQGDIIGYVGSTGNVKSSQLHFAIRDGKSPVDPKKYLTTNVAGL